MANTQSMTTSFMGELLTATHNFGTAPTRGTSAADTFKGALYLASATINASTTAYSATVPAQTTAAAFRVGAAEAFADDYFWSSTESSTTDAWNQNFNSGNPGNQNNNTKTNANYVRAFR